MPLDPNDIEKTEKISDFVTKNNFMYNSYNYCSNNNRTIISYDS